MRYKRTFRAFMLLLLAACFIWTTAEETDLSGEWVFKDDPETLFITLNADGTALYGGLECCWQADESVITLTDEAGASALLMYEETESGITVFVPTRYTRISEIGGESEILGTWQAEGESLSSFVFTGDGRFLEDGVFTGSYADDTENGRVTLKYAQGLFADTVIFYSFDGDALVISYPWALARR